MHRRHFFHMAAVAAALQPGAISLAKAATKAVAGRSADSVATDEDFWFQVRHAFAIDRNLINLNNGGVSPTPRSVLAAQHQYDDMSSMGPSYYMWRMLTPEIEVIRRRLAGHFGCSPEELAITRNASEALETVQLGLTLKPGDEVLTTNQDYPRMLTTWQQRERRDGIKLKTITFPVPAPSMDDLAQRFERAITPRTKVIMFCHITNRTGQIFPVKRIAQMARARGIQTLVDGAHAFAQFPFQASDLDCDYYGTSLHKWVLAPIGTGFLYVRKEHIANLWPLMAAPAEMTDNIRKFEEIGTHPAAQRNAINEALTFHESIGTERKAARLRYLRQRWSQKLVSHPRVKLLASDDPEHSCGIGFLSVDGMESTQLAGKLLEKYRILVTAFPTLPEYDGIRVTPNIYTTVEEIDFFAKSVEDLLKA